MPDIIKNMSPKSSFFAGVAAMIMLGFIVGFFILLSATLSQRRATIAAAPSPSSQAAAAQSSGVASIPPVTADDWMRGNPNAAITIVEYSDLECPYCQRFHPTMQQVIENYGDRIRWVYRHFPLASLHSKAPKEAEAAECAGELGGQDGFWSFIDRVFEITPANNGLDPKILPEIAAYAGVDRAEFSACLDSGKYADNVQSEYNDAVAAGGQGTPFSVVITADGEQIPVSGAVPYEQIASFLDQVL